MTDKWKKLRDEGLWANVEPEVELRSMTVPVTIEDDVYVQPVTELRFCPNYKWSKSGIESQVSEAAIVSTGAQVKDQDSLVRKLINMGHHTPLEAIQFNFRITGISKACGAQMSRHRVGQGHVSSSRRYQTQGIQFVYPLLENIDDEDVARRAYCVIQDSYKQAYSEYQGLRSLGVKKGDCRYLIPTASASERIWWVNARALRDFLRLRLHPTAEAEIRRLANLLLDIVIKITPTLFEDFNE